MKVILSIEPVSYPLTGIGRYTWELASGLIKSEQLSDLKLFSRYEFFEELSPPKESADQSYRIKQWVKKSYIASECYRLCMPWLQQKALKKYSNYIYHGPNFYLPPFSGRKIATFHDLSPFTWTECHSPQRVRFMQKEIKYTLSKADILITDSEYVRQELAEYFNWPIKNIYSVPLACSSNFHPRSEQECCSVLTKYNLCYQNYALYVGTLEPRKNIVILLDSYSRLPLTVRQKYPLILAGYQGWQNEKIIEKIVNAEKDGWVRYLGYVPTNDLGALFSGARIFCFPSLYEGFGLPVLEAMASGVPVICSNSSSLFEIASSAAFMCLPQDVEAMTLILRQGLEDMELRSIAIKNGLAQARKYSWSRCVTQTIKVYNKL